MEQMSPAQKTVATLITLAFAGALMVYTAMANLALLKSLYPDPQFYMFGLLALEGGIAFWTGYFLLHPKGSPQRGLSVFCLAVDAILSGTGFFYEMEILTHSQGTISLPPVIVVVSFAVVFNVGMAIIAHLLPHPAGHAHVKMDPPAEYNAGYQGQAAALSQTGTIDRGPGLLTRGAAEAIDKAASLLELAEEKRQARHARKQAKAQLPTPGDEEAPKNE